MAPMQAAILEEAGAQLVMRSDVEIAPPNARQLRVRVTHCGVCHSDLSIADGLFPAPVPIVLGHEAAGVVEEVGADVNARDNLGFTPLHNAAARGDVEMIMYLVERGADVRALTRKGETTADMANGPVQRITVFPEVVKLLESLGSDNNHNCVSCQ